MERIVSRSFFRGKHAYDSHPQAHDGFPDVVRRLGSKQRGNPTTIQTQVRWIKEVRTVDTLPTLKSSLRT